MTDLNVRSRTPTHKRITCHCFAAVPVTVFGGTLPQARYVVSRCLPTSPTSSFTDHRPPSSEIKQSFVSFRTTADVLIKKHLEERRLLTCQPNMGSGESCRSQQLSRIATDALKVFPIQLRGDLRQLMKVSTPREIQCNNEHHGQKAPLRYATVPSPRLTKASHKFEPSSHPRMTFKVRMPNTIQDATINSQMI